MSSRTKSALLIGTVLGTAFAVAQPAHAQTSASPYTAATRYDAMRRAVGTIAPDPDGDGPLAHAATRNTYDGAGRLTKVERGELSSWQSEAVAPANWTNFTVLQTLETQYDSMDRKAKETLSGVPSGGGSATVQTVTQYSYDAVGRLQCTAVRMNPDEFASLPTSACTPDTEGSAGPDRIVKNVHDAAGQLLQVREGVGTAIEAAEATYSYTPNGKREYVIDGEGARAQLVHDGHDRIIYWIFPSTTRSAYNDSTQATALSTAGSVNLSDYEQYGLDQNGNRTWIRKRDASIIGFSYDALNRMTMKNVGGIVDDVYYGYDARGRQTFARFGSTSGPGITNVWDGLGQLTSSTIDLGGTSRTLSYLYDDNGNRKRVTHPDGNYFTTNHDGLNRASEILENGTTSLATFTYNQLGRRKRFDRGNGTYSSYGYDGGSRLASLDEEFPANTASNHDVTLAYNHASQIISRNGTNNSYAITAPAAGTTASTINGLNQIAVHGGTTFGHDPNGNLSSDGATTFAYDVENRLVSATGAKNATLTYDPMGRLHSLTSGGTTTTFLHDGDELVAEYAGTTLLRRYVHGASVDDPVVRYEGATLTDRRHLHADERGSIVATTNSSGATPAINRYDEYGVPATANQGRFGYTGQVWLPELGLWYYKARMYRPEFGRFMQVDPVAYDDQMNLYVYVQNDPMNFSDPDGKITCCYESIDPDRDQATQLGRAVERDPRGAANTIALIIEGLTIAADVVNGPTPDVSLAGVAIGRGIREAAERRAGNIARGVPESRLSGSGHPRQHTIRHSRRHEAREAAERDVPAGGRVRHDAHPGNPRQGPHYQAEGPNGRNARPVRHHEYPKRQR